MALKIPARLVLLTDVTGQVVSTTGDQTNVDLAGLGSLIAADRAASQEIAGLSGEYDGYQLILREGTQTHTFISEAGPQLILMVQIPNYIPLGWARMLIQKGAGQLEEIIAERPPRSEQINQVFQQDDLSARFNQALDDLWVE